MDFKLVWRFIVSCFCSDNWFLRSINCTSWSFTSAETRARTWISSASSLWSDFSISSNCTTRSRDSLQAIWATLTSADTCSNFSCVANNSCSKSVLVWFNCWASSSLDSFVNFTSDSSATMLVSSLATNWSFDDKSSLNFSSLTSRISTNEDKLLTFWLPAATCLTFSSFSFVRLSSSSCFDWMVMIKADFSFSIFWTTSSSRSTWLSYFLISPWLTVICSVRSLRMMACFWWSQIRSAFSSSSVLMLVSCFSANSTPAIKSDCILSFSILFRVVKSLIWDSKEDFEIFSCSVSSDFDSILFSSSMICWMLLCKAFSVLSCWLVNEAIFCSNSLRASFCSCSRLTFLLVNSSIVSLKFSDSSLICSKDFFNASSSASKLATFNLSSSFVTSKLSFAVVISANNSLSFEFSFSFSLSCRSITHLKIKILFSNCF